MALSRLRHEGYAAAVDDLRKRGRTRTQPLGAAMLILLGLLWAAPADAQRAFATPGEADAADARQIATAGHCDRALAAFDRAIAVRQEDGPLRRDRGTCHEKLGNTKPAIDDYQAYLTMTPRAADAADIQARMDRLRKLQGESQSAADPKLAAEGSSSSEFVPSSAPAPYLLGVHGGYSAWSNKGLPENSTGIGVRFGYRYSAGSELDIRGRYIQSGSTGISASSGYSISAAQLWFVDVGVEWELGLGAGLGFERHETKLRTNRSFIHARLNPLLRWNFSPDFALDLGPELGAGLMTSEGTVGEEQSNQFVFRYGGAAVFNWRWGGSTGKPAEASGEDDSW